MRFRNAIITLFAALLTLGFTLGCERQDVEEATDQDDAGVLQPDEEGPLSADPEEATDELPGVEPGQVPDASLAE